MWVQHSGSVRASLHMILVGILMLAVARVVLTSLVVEALILAPSEERAEFKVYVSRFNIVPVFILKAVRRLRSALAPQPCEASSSPPRVGAGTGSKATASTPTGAGSGAAAGRVSGC